MSINIKQVKGLEDQLRDKADKSDLELLEALQKRINTLEDRINALTDNGKITTMSLVENETE